VKRSAWSITPRETSSQRARPAKIGSPAASADVQPAGRRWFERNLQVAPEPAGVLFEIATLGPGFAADEDPAHLGEKLILPPAFEHLRDRVEPVLTPLPDPRADWAAR